MFTPIFESAKAASRRLVGLSDERRAEILLHVADALSAAGDEIIAANAEDLQRMDADNPLRDRLLLDRSRLEGVCSGIRDVSRLPSPLGRIYDERRLENGLRLRKITVAFGVVGVIYEARPNVTADVFALCFRSGNVCVLKGGRDADATNCAIVSVIRSVLEAEGCDADACSLLPATHEATAALLSAVGYVDLCIPRGGRRLIDFVRDNARVPVIETGAGVVHTYFDAAGDLSTGRAVVNNAKTRRVSVCNALDCLLVDRSRLGDLPDLVSPMNGRVELVADAEAYAALEGRYAPLRRAAADDFGREWMSYTLTVGVVSGVEAAIAHINRYGSGHSESIVTADADAADAFRRCVDAACVYVNAPTSFTDGAQFGLGAEIGISTQKLGPRGPMGLAELTTYKWLIDGDGQTRP